MSAVQRVTLTGSVGVGAKCKENPRRLAKVVSATEAALCYKSKLFIGEGTFGEVVMAQDLRNNRLVAIKTLKHPLSVHDPRTSREINFFRLVPSHNILVSLLDIIKDPETNIVSLVMDYMDFDLAQLLCARRFKALSPSVYGKIACDVARGMAYIHAHNFVHRDLKPSNILLGHGLSGLEVRICDFGLARYVGPSSKNGNQKWSSYVATRWYRAPEQILELPTHSFALDIWSYGAIIVEMANFTPLFPGNNQANMVKFHVRVLGTPAEENPGGSLNLGQTGKQMHGALHLLYYGYHRGRDASKLIPNGNYHGFAKLASACLQWEPTRRISAPRLLREVMHESRLLKASKNTQRDKVQTYPRSS